MKTITYIERPFIIYENRIYNKFPEIITIQNGKLLYWFVMYDGKDLLLENKYVYETEKKAKKHLK